MGDQNESHKLRNDHFYQPEKAYFPGPGRVAEQSSANNMSPEPQATLNRRNKGIFNRLYVNFIIYCTPFRGSTKANSRDETMTPEQKVLMTPPRALPNPVRATPIPDDAAVAAKLSKPSAFATIRNRFIKRKHRGHRVRRGRGNKAGRRNFKPAESIKLGNISPPTKGPEESIILPSRPDYSDEIGQNWTINRETGDMNNKKDNYASIYAPIPQSYAVDSIRESMASHTPSDVEPPTPAAHDPRNKGREAGLDAFRKLLTATENVSLTSTPKKDLTKQVVDKTANYQMNTDDDNLSGPLIKKYSLSKSSTGIDEPASPKRNVESWQQDDDRDSIALTDIMSPNQKLKKKSFFSSQKQRNQASLGRQHQTSLGRQQPQGNVPLGRQAEVSLGILMPSENKTNKSSEDGTPKKYIRGQTTLDKMTQLQMSKKKHGGSARTLNRNNKGSENNNSGNVKVLSAKSNQSSSEHKKNTGSVSNDFSNPSFGAEESNFAALIPPLPESARVSSVSNILNILTSKPKHPVTNKVNNLSQEEDIPPTPLGPKDQLKATNNNDESFDILQSPNYINKRKMEEKQEASRSMFSSARRKKDKIKHKTRVRSKVRSKKKKQQLVNPEDQYTIEQNPISAGTMDTDLL